MAFNLAAYELIFSDHALTNELEHSNKTLIPAACIPDLNLDAGTTYIEIINPNINDKIAVCSVHEYTETPGIIFIPSRIMQTLGINASENIKVNQKIDIPKGEFIKIKPYEKAFIELSDPKAVLERHISQFYPVLSKGELISIKFAGKEHQIEIVETRPENVIQTTNCDINLEFARPYDMGPEETKENKTHENVKTNIDENVKMDIDENVTLREEKVADSEEHVVIGRTRPHIYQHQRSREDLRRFPGRGYKLGSS